MKKEDNSREAEKVNLIGIVGLITNEYNDDELIENVLLLTHHTFTTSIDVLDIIDKTFFSSVDSIDAIKNDNNMNITQLSPSSI